MKATVKSKKQSFRKWMKIRTWADRQAYVIARNEAEKVKLAEKSRAWVQIGKNFVGGLEWNKADTLKHGKEFYK